MVFQELNFPANGPVSGSLLSARVERFAYRERDQQQLLHSFNASTLPTSKKSAEIKKDFRKPDARVTQYCRDHPPAHLSLPQEIYVIHTESARDGGRHNILLPVPQARAQIAWPGALFFARARSHALNTNLSSFLGAAPRPPPPSPPPPPYHLLDVDELMN